MRTIKTLLAFSLLVTMVAVGSGAASAGERSSYIVVFEQGAVADVEAAASQLSRAHRGQLGFVYQHALQGFSATLSAGAAAALARNPAVAYVEADQPVSIATAAQGDNPTGIERIFADENTNIDIDGSDDFRVDVDVAVIDTGIDIDHPDLNVVQNINCTNETGGPPWSRTAFCDGSGDDDNGHGTHVAGTIGALDNGPDTGGIAVVGVAPGARLWAVKVLKANGSGSYSMVIAGVDWVTANAAAIEVANMSLGGGNSQALKDAIQNSVAAGVAYAVAAGNSSVDAKDSSPANSPHALTISALADFDGEPGGGAPETCRPDEDDTFANFSNYGDGKTKAYSDGTDTARTVPLIAPGACILSTVPGGYATYSGTSMASPHAAGALALLASGTNSPSNASGVYALYTALIGAGNADWSDGDDPDAFKEPLLDVSTFLATLVATGGGGGGDALPTVAVTSPTDGATVSGTIAVTANATDDNGVTQVQFFVDGASIGIDSNSSDGWLVNWDTTTASEGSHTVSATATDTIGQTASDSVSVTVDNIVGGIELSVTAYKVKGLQKADLSWSGATSASVDIYRDGTVIATTANDGAFTDNIDQRGGGSYTYKVCEAGTSTCSNEATANY